MNSELRRTITAALHIALGAERGSLIASLAPAGHSSFTHTAKLTLQSGARFFLKYSAVAPPGMFASEHRSLRLLHAADALQVPEPVCSGEHFLVTTWLDFGRKGRHWDEELGRGLALLHQRTQNARYGFGHDNWLGLTPQRNAWQDDWLAFWRDCRMSPQLALWRERCDGGDELLKLGERLLSRLEIYLADVREPAVLLHGDLWSGNAGALADGSPAIYDPASYYGHGEAEFGMMRLFGGFGPRVEAAYAEIRPFAAGSEERIALYRLYHELNHLNLFGAAYHAQCRATLESLL